MSKIIINEIDNTTRALGEYQNFTVVVPGFLGEGTATKEEIDAAFDDNGIIELHKLADFNKYIGKKKSTKTSLKPVSPELTPFKIIPAGDPTEQDPDPKPTIINYQTVEQGDFYGKYKDCLYIAEEQNETTNVGYLQGQFDLTGETTETYWEFTKATQHTEGIKYVYIEQGNEGIDQADYTSQGNHMAYELLSLGYTVLFKKLNMEQPEPEDSETVEPITPADELAQMDTAEFWACLKDKSTYDFRYITTGGYANILAYKQIGAVATFRKGDDVLEPTYPEGGTAETAPGRGDCCALIDFPEEYIEGSGKDKDKYNLQKVKANQSKLIQTIRNLGNHIFSNNLYFNEYSKLFVPNVIYDLGTDSIYNPTTTYVTFPGSFHYLACAARAYRTVREWFAVAGYDNGISDFKVAGTTLTLGELATNALQPRIAYSQDSGAFNRGINIITKVRGSYYLWGNRTAHEIKQSGLIASDFANIRELCSSLKKVIWVACKQLTFSPNSDLLWVNFCNKVRPLLDAMKANEGVKDYAFVKVPTDKKAVMLGKIRIVPIEAVEDFELDLYLENSIEGQVIEVEEN